MENIQSLNRILDANINRCVEGIRVIEDLVRFKFMNEEFTEKFRNLRHFIRKSYATYDIELVMARDASEDIGTTITQKSNLDKKSDYKQIVLANFKRITESLRVIEEYTKIFDYALSKEIESKRYIAYMLEIEVLLLLK